MFDTHCHLNYPKLYNQLPQILTAARTEGVTGIICIGTALVNLKANEKAIQIAKEQSTKELPIWASVGVYPHEDTSFKTENLLQKLGNLISEYCPLNPPTPLTLGVKTIVAIGECGLDLNLSLDQADQAAGMEYRNLEEQITLFEGQIKLAKKYNLPLIVHSRNSAKETLSILDSHFHGNDKPGVIHSFTYDYETAKQFIELGFYLGINGIVTFNSAKELQEAVTSIPLEYLLLETDAPYLSPTPFRGETNTPARVKLVAEKIASLKSVPIEKVVEITTDNAKKLFSI